MPVIEFWSPHKGSDDGEPQFVNCAIATDEVTTRADLTTRLTAVGITAAGGMLATDLGYEYRAGGAEWPAGRCGLSVAVSCEESTRATVEAAIAGVLVAMG